MQYLVKTLLSAMIIVFVAELSKKSGLIGGLVASLPVVSLLAMIWLYIDTKSVEKVMNLSIGIFWMVIPSLALFLILPFFLKKHIPFYSAITISCCLTGFIYYLAYIVYAKLGIKI